MNLFFFVFVYFLPLRSGFKKFWRETSAAKERVVAAEEEWLLEGGEVAGARVTARKRE